MRSRPAPHIKAMHRCHSITFFFFNDTAPTEIYTLSLHDALPIFGSRRAPVCAAKFDRADARIVPQTRKQPRGDNGATQGGTARDRKSTRLNSSHTVISYAVFCLKKKKKSARIIRAVKRRLLRSAM